MAEIEKWITINGTHIPIIKGESKAKAVSNFIKAKKQARRKRMYDKYFDYADKATAIAAKKLELENEMKGGNIYTDDMIYWDSHDLGQEVADMKFERKYGKNWNKLSKHTIKGAGKTKGMKDADKKFIEEYNKGVSEWIKATKPTLHDLSMSDSQVNDIYRKADSNLTKAREKAKAKQTKSYTYKLKTDKPKTLSPNTIWKLEKAKADTKRRREKRGYNAARNRWLKQGGK